MNLTKRPGCCNGTEPYIYVSSHIMTYAVPVMTIVGIVGNTLSAIVMLMARQRRHTTSLYILVLSALDTAFLLTVPTKIWIEALWNINIQVISSSGCKLHNFIVFFLAQLEAWVLVFVSIERFIAVWWPMKVKMIYTRRVAAFQVMSTGLVLACVNIHTFWTRDIFTTISTIQCKYDDLVKKIWGITDMLLSSVIPFIIMLSCSILIVLRIQLSKFRRTSVSMLKMSSITTMLVTVCIAFVIFTLPKTLLMSFYQETITAFGCCYTMHVIKPVILMFMLANYSINFVLYCLSGSIFRSELKKLFTCMTCKYGTAKCNIPVSGAWTAVCKISGSGTAGSSIPVPGTTVSSRHRSDNYIIEKHTNDLTSN